MSDPDWPNGSQRGVEERGLDVVQGGGSGLREPGTNLRRISAVPGHRGSLDLSDERLSRGALPSPRNVALSDSLLPDLLDHGRVMRAEVRTGDGGGAALTAASEERLALGEGHEEMVAEEPLAVHDGADGEQAAT